MGRPTDTELAFGMLKATAFAGGGGTLYSRFGDWFAWLSLLILATCLTDVVRRRSSDGATH